VTLGWAPNTEADVVGYVVSRASTSGGTYTKLTATPIATTSYVDPAAPNGATWYYKVSAVDTSGNTSSSASVNATVPDLEAPKSPAGLLATGGDAEVGLVWTKNAETDVAGYNLYRWNADAPGTITKVNAALLTGTAYTDRPVVNGAGYGYQLTAVDKTGNVSTLSDPAVAKAADVTAPAAPAGVAATGVKTGVTVTWTRGTEVDLAGYHVYRATADGAFTRITPDLVTGTTLTDTGAPADVTSSYQVTAVDKVGNESARSVTKSATPADTTPPAQPSGSRRYRRPCRR